MQGRESISLPFQSDIKSGVGGGGNGFGAHVELDVVGIAVKI